MPKVKTRKIMAKRFRITRRGKVLHRTQGMRHIRRNKSAARKRRQDKGGKLTNRKEIRKVIRSLSA